MFFNKLHGQGRVYYGDKHYWKQRKSVRSLRKFIEFLEQRHSFVSILGLLLHSLLEIVSVGIYVWTVQMNQCQTLWDFEWAAFHFHTEIALNVIFTVEWVLIFLVEEDKKRYLFSWLSLINLITSVPIIILGIGSLFDSNYRRGWIPMYLRIWWIKNCIGMLLDYPQIARRLVDKNREICRFIVRLIAVLGSCIGTFQIVQSCTGSYIDLFDSTYLMIVTFDSLGYGDIFPNTTLSRLLMTFFVIIGIGYFLPLFQRLARIGERRQYYTSYNTSTWWGCQTRKHVVICGEFSDLGFEVLLRNFYSGWRKYLSTSIVFLFPNAYSTGVDLIARASWYQGRVHLLVGDPTKAVDLERAGAKHADAIFLFGDTCSAAYYRDYEIIRQSVAIRLFDSELPQLLMLRRGRTMRQIAPYAACALQIEGTVHHLLGLSMVNPGVIPFVINLMNTYEPLPIDVRHACDWLEKYEYSIRNDLYEIEVPDSLRGREFPLLVRAFFEYDMTLIGVLDAHYVVQLNPAELIPNAKKLLLIARSLKAVQLTTAAISREFEMTFAEEMLVAPEVVDRAAPWSRPRGSPSCARTPIEPPTPSPAGFSTSMSASPPTLEHLVPLNDAFGCEKHFLMIDLSAAKGKDATTRYAREGHLAALAQDVYAVVRPVRQALPYSDIVLLTQDISFGPYFAEDWEFEPGAAAPLYYVLGCGLNASDLARCHLEDCAGCCVFFAGDISREGSTAAMAMLVVLTIHDLLHGAPTFPVVVELEGLIHLPLFPPVAEDGELLAKASVDFVFEPNFLIGNAVSREMLLPALQRTYFMEEFIDVMNILINGHAKDLPALSQLPLTMCAVELGTYEEVLDYCLKMGFLPIALYRCIRDAKNPSLDGLRYVLTNPPKHLTVDQLTDIVYYLIPD